MPLAPLLARTKLWPLVPVVVAAALYLTRLGSYGFWEPNEIQVADRARAAIDQRAATAGVGQGAPSSDSATEPVERDDDPPAAAQAGAAAEPGAPSEPGMAEPAKKSVATPKNARSQRSTLTEELVGAGLDLLGATEVGARSLLALLGVIAVAAVTLIGVRLGGPRAGMLAGLAFLSFPLVVMESRHLTSEIGTLAGAALLAAGLLGLARPPRGTPSRWGSSALGGLGPPWVTALDVALVVAGWWLADRSGAIWNGLVPPIAGVGLGALAAGAGGQGRAERRLLVAGGVMVALAVVLVGHVLHQALVIVDATVGERDLFGKAIVPAVRLFDGIAVEHGEIVRVAGDGGYIASLGGPWRAHGDAASTATSLFEQIAFGTFPWVALLPLAIAGLSRAGRLAAVSLGAWATVAWAMATIYANKVGATTYPAYAALAVAIGLWLDGRWRSDAEVDADASVADADAARPLPVAVLFALCAIAVVGKDLVSFPDRLISLDLLGKTLKWPEGSKLHLVLPVLGAGFAAAMALAIALLGRRRRLAGRCLVAAIGFALVGALFVGHVLTRGLSERLSSKGMFAAYRALRHDGDKLGIVGDPGPSARFYAGDDVVSLRGRNQLIEFLERPERVFALTRRTRRAGESAGELCALHKLARTSALRFHVLDDSNEQFALLSNHLGPGEVDLDALSNVIVRERPRDLGAPLDVEYEGTLRLIGVRVPRKVGRGERFDITLIFEALKPVNRNWKVFLHFDSGSSRFQGDHDPMGGRCGATSLQAGDIVVDTFSLDAGSLVEGTPTGTYGIYAGFFVGASPNYTNMKVTKGKADDNNRVQIGTIELD